MRKILSFLLVAPLFLFAQVTAEKVLAKAVSYHDPSDAWSDLSATFYFKETRPNGPDRSTTIELDNSKGYMKINRNEDEVYEVIGGDAKIIKGNESIERALMLRNYYLYLWGLPMKLYDKGTPEIVFSTSEKVGYTNCKVVRVKYEEDTWYFYFDEFSGRMLQYKFYKDEAAGKGELIKLAGEIDVQGIKIPKERSWYVLPGMKYLGTDILESAQ